MVEARVIRKTKLMRRVETTILKGEPLEVGLPRIYNQLGPTATAKHFAVSKATINYWVMVIGYVHVNRIVPMAEDPRRAKPSLGPSEEFVKVVGQEVRAALVDYFGVPGTERLLGAVREARALTDGRQT